MSSLQHISVEVLLLFVAVCLGGHIALLSDKLSSSHVSSLLGWLEG
jgi:hypothetical protein